MDNAIFKFNVDFLTNGPLGDFPVPHLIVGVNSLKDCSELGQTLPRIKTQNSVAFIRPVPDTIRTTPGPTACVADSLRFRQVRFTYSDLFLGALLFAQVEDVHDALVGTLKA